MKTGRGSKGGEGFDVVSKEQKSTKRSPSLSTLRKKTRSQKGQGTGLSPPG